MAKRADERLQLFGEGACRRVRGVQAFRRRGSFAAQLLFIDCRQPPVIEHQASADHDAVDGGAVLGEHDLRHEVVARHVIDVAEIKKYVIRPVAGRDRTFLLIEAGNSVTPAGQMRSMSENGYRAGYLHVPGAGHLVHDEAPQVYRQAVEAFLAAP